MREGVAAMLHVASLRGVAALQRESHYGCRMTIGWRFIGEVWGTYKRPLVLECVVPIPNRKEAEAIAKQRLKGANSITAIELFQPETGAPAN